MNSIGIDLHSSTVFMVALNEQGKILCDANAKLPLPPVRAVRSAIGCNTTSRWG